MIRGIVTFTVIISIIAIVLSAYFTYFVDSPEDVISEFFEAYENLDVFGMAAKIDPKYEKMFNATSNIFGHFVGVGLVDVFSFLPLLATKETKQQISLDIEVVSVNITGKTMNKFVEEYGDKIKGIGNALGDRANAVVTFKNPNGEDRITDRVFLKKFKSSGWRILIDELELPNLTEALERK